MDIKFKNIKIVPLKNVYVHEGTVEKWVERLANFLEQSGIMRNPIIAAAKGGKYVVLDGMHRVAAFKKLKCKDIVIAQVDYFSPNIKLFGWDALIMGNVDWDKLLDGIKNFYCEKIKLRSFDEVKALLKKRKIILGYHTKNKGIYGLRPSKARLEDIVKCVIKLEDALDNLKKKIIYAADDKSIEQFKTSSAGNILFRPAFTKKEVVDFTLEGKLFPRKSTRHIIPQRPLRADISLTLLREKVNVKIKNQLLQSELNWKWMNNKVRYYPESVIVFDD